MKSVKNHEAGYGLISKTLHWLMAIMLVTLVIVGTYMVGLERSDPPRDFLYGMHKSFGALFLLLALLRVLWVSYSRGPKLPEQLAGWEKLLSKLVTGLLYLLLLAIPVSGIAISNFFGAPVTFLGLFEFPIIFEKDMQMLDTAKTIHMGLVFLSLFMIALHVAGALKHRYLDADGVDVLSWMLPVRR